MKLLLDEHFSKSISEQLRARGHDVIAVQEDLQLRQVGDADLLLRATADGRALVTENARDFLPLHMRYVGDSEPHGGIVLSSPRSFPRRTATVGRFVRALEALLESDPSLDTALIWLATPSRRPPG